MQSLSVKKSNLISVIQIPASKSYANRALIVAALSNQSPKIKNIPQSTDVKNLINALKQVGLKTLEDDGLQFLNSFPDCELGDQVIPIGDGGTTARFFATFLLLGRCSYQLELGGRLKDRPWEEFLKLASSLGAKAELNGNILLIKGPAKFPEILEVDCSKTTQFATAFALLENVTKTKVIPLHLNSSQSYWKMTDKVTSDIKFQSTYEIPRDWSSASYPLAFGALNQDIFFPGLIYDPHQADAKFFDILQNLACLDQMADGLAVRKLIVEQSIDMDVSDCLDLVPALSFFLSHLKGHHKLYGIENLVHKESDRLSEILKLLKTFEKEALVKDGILHIKGNSSKLSSSVNLSLPEDHRMVMAGTLFLLHHGGGTISPQDAVKKSYSDFFSIISA